MTYQVGDKVRVRRKYDSGTFVLDIDEVFNDGVDDIVVGLTKVGTKPGEPKRRVKVRADRIYGYARSNTKTDTGPKFTATAAKKLYDRADEAGRTAGAAAIPAPMVVGTPKNMMASLMGGDDGGFDENEPVYFVSEGVCGFAQVRIRPASGSFARQMKKLGVGYRSYYGGWDISVRYGGQSLQRKEAYAKAFAKVLQDAGVEAYVDSRMD